MSKDFIHNNILQSIADAIRYCDDTTAGIAPVDYAERIRAIDKLIPQSDALNFYMPNGGTISFIKTGSPTVVELEYSIDRGATWTVWPEDQDGNRSLVLNAGQRMYVRNTSNRPISLYNNDENKYYFSFNSDTYANGKFESIICKNVNYIGIVNGAFRKLFSGQSNLRSIPEIRSNIKGSFMYHNTFYNNHIEEVYIDCPVPYETMFYYAFNRCSRLKKVVTNMTDISAPDCLYNWLKGVAATGDFYCPAELTIPTGPSGIPSGWTRHNIDGDKYLNFTMPEGGTITLTKNGSPTEVTLEYLIEGAPNWVTWQPDVNGNRTLTLPVNGKVYIRNTSTTSTGFSTSDADYYQFAFSNTTEAHGNTNSLLCRNSENALLTDYCFRSLFANCENLTTAPELPAAGLAQNCYKGMFSNCTSLVAAPDLPATTLAALCYRSMFYGCTRLVNAPDLPATTLASECYNAMFYECTTLSEIRIHATNISASNCLTNWLSSVAVTGDFYCPTELTITSGPNGIPSGWTRHDI